MDNASKNVTAKIIWASKKFAAGLCQMEYLNMNKLFSLLIIPFLYLIPIV